MNGLNILRLKNPNLKVIVSFKIIEIGKEIKKMYGKNLEEKEEQIVKKDKILPFKVVKKE
jgi:hypothetical protein